MKIEVSPLGFGSNEEIRDWQREFISSLPSRFVSTPEFLPGSETEASRRNPLYASQEDIIWNFDAVLGKFLPLSPDLNNRLMGASFNPKDVEDYVHNLIVKEFG